jgi:hypothetical protein
LLHLIEKEYGDISFFSVEEHEFKKFRGVVDKFIYDYMLFYFLKGLGAGAAMAGKASWELRGESFGPMGADIAVRMPEDNQVLIAEGTVVIFNAGKFERLFAYDARVQALSEGYAREIEEAYGLSFPEGLTLNALLADKKPLVKKLEGVEIGEMKQEQVVDYADEMGLELMTDEGGKIIIMDEKDLAMFVGLLSEDYFVSPVSGRRYLVRSKKLLDGGGGEPPRG